MNKYFLFLSMSLIASVSVQAQVLKVWKNDSVTHFNMSTQVDSMTFRIDSLKLWGSGLDVSYQVGVDMDSVTFSEGVHYGNMTDERDGKVYKTVKIGEQVWMAENLNYGNYLEDLGYGTGGNAQYQALSEKFCYGNVEANCNSDGGLYQWHTIMNLNEDCINGSKSCAELVGQKHRGVCPIGWHIPKNEEWNELLFVLGTIEASNKMKRKSFGGTNSSGFSAIATGSRRSGGGFGSHNTACYFWEAEEGNPLTAYFRHLGGGTMGRNHTYKRVGFPIRCLKD